VRRGDGAARGAEDRERYQTIYAERRGAIAAPDRRAALHARVLAACARAASPSRDHSARRLRHVRARARRATSASTPSPPSIRDHAGGRRRARRSARARAAHRRRRHDHRARSESAADERTLRVTPGARSTALTITPGYKFKVVNALVTNFHLPRSSLLVLIASFAGRELTLAAYRHAVAARYRFYSYGDCMLIF
jgi:S-adenosylmethionine:tRNA ribosyltransferase-isomerase